MTEGGSPNEVESFLAIAGPNLERGCGAQVAAICASTPDGLLNLATSIILTPFPELDGAQGPALVASHGLYAFRGVVAPERVLSLVRGVFAGRVDAKDLPEGVGHPVRFERGGSGERLEIGEPHLLECDGSENPVAVPAWVAVGSGGSIDEIVPYRAWQAIERALPAGDPPFASVEELARQLFIQNYLNNRSAARVVLCSPYWLRLVGAVPRVSEGKIDVEVQAAWEDPTGATLSFMPSSPLHSAAKRILPLEGSSWHPLSEGRWTSWTTSVPVTADLGPCRLSLNYGGQQIDSMVTGLSVGRLAAHALVDPDFERLRDRLRAGKDGKTADRFEQGVCWLLHLAGLSSVPYGAKDLQHGADVVAFDEERSVLFGECTVALPDDSKIQQIRSNALAYKRLITERYGKSMFVAAVIFCPQSRPPGIEDRLAQIYDEQHVAIAFAEDLEKLLEGALQGELPGTLLIGIATAG